MNSGIATMPVSMFFGENHDADNWLVSAANGQSLWTCRLLGLNTVDITIMEQ
jgi:hypothetical protein